MRRELARTPRGPVPCSRGLHAAAVSTRAPTIRSRGAKRFTAVTFTGITGRAEKPADAWSAEQVADFMIDAMGKGDFYILCPDNAVTREMDEKRVQWAAEDLIKNRPALSRWHPDYKDAFQRFMTEKHK
jgi:hypothetical protein